MLKLRTVHCSTINDICSLWRNWFRIVTSLTENFARDSCNHLVLSTERTLLPSVGVQKVASGPIFGFLTFFLFYSDSNNKHSLHLHITRDFKTFWWFRIFLFSEMLLNELVDVNYIFVTFYLMYGSISVNQE